MPAPGGVSPDMLGFRDAQRKLRDQFGEDVTFFMAEQLTYPAGTAVDPETGEPYDPTIEPETTVQDSFTVHCSVAFISQANRDTLEFKTSALGDEERTHVLVIADYGDRDLVNGAVEFTWRGDPFKVEAQKPDGIGSPQRILTWGRRK